MTTIAAVRRRSNNVCLISLLLTLLSDVPNAVFYQCSDFNKDLSRWDVSSVTNMEGGASLGESCGHTIFV